MKFLTFFKDDKAFANVYTGIFQKIFFLTCNLLNMNTKVMDGIP